MTTDDRLERIETKIDTLSTRHEDLRVSVEHRMTKLEVKAKVAGILSGLLSSIGLSWVRGH